MTFNLDLQFFRDLNVEYPQKNKGELGLTSITLKSTSRLPVMQR